MIDTGDRRHRPADAEGRADAACEIADAIASRARDVGDTGSLVGVTPPCSISGEAKRRSPRCSASSNLVSDRGIGEHFFESARRTLEDGWLEPDADREADQRPLRRSLQLTGYRPPACVPSLASRVE